MTIKSAEADHDLILRNNFFADINASAAHAVLMRRVFEIEAEPRGQSGPVWVPFSYFDRAGRCVASIEVAVLELMLDGEAGSATAIRRAAVDSAWRGRGLFRDLMRPALAWCEAAATGPTLLYTEDHALYERFGFRPLAQHAFVGAPPEKAPGKPARILDAERPADHSVIEALLARRAPVSTACAIVNAASLFIANMTQDDLVLAHAPDLDALICYEENDGALTLVDIVAAAIPSMARLLGVLPPTSGMVTTLFPPDRLDWDGRPVADDAGLMARGTPPNAMRRPFMLPPTMAF